MSNRILTPFEVDSDSDNIVELEVKSDKELYLKNSQVQANTAVVDSVLSLSNASTGKLQYRGINESYVYKSALAPMTPKPYELWFNTNDNSLNFWDGLAWVNISANPASNKAYFHATINPTGQSIPAQATNATSVKVVWNSVIEDNESKWNVANNQYEIPRNGKYLITTMLRTQGTTSGADVSAFASVFLNNSLHKEFLVESISFSGALPAPNIGVRLIGSILLNLNQNDLIDIRVFMSNAVWSGVTLQTAQPSAHFDFKIIEL